MSAAISITPPPESAATHQVPLDVLGKHLCATGDHGHAAQMFARAAHECDNTRSDLSKEDMVRYARFLQTLLASEATTSESTFTFAMPLTLWDMNEVERLHEWVVNYMAYYMPTSVLTFRHSEDGKCMVVKRDVKARSDAPVALSPFMGQKRRPLPKDDAKAMSDEIDDLIKSGEEGDSDDDDDDIVYFYYY